MKLTKAQQEAWDNKTKNYPPLTKSKKSGTGKIKVSPWTKEEQDKKKNNKKKEQEKINMKWASTII